MFTLLRQENYKLHKGKSLIVSASVIVIYQILVIFLSKQYNIMSGNVYFSTMGKVSSIIDLIMVVIASTIITNEFAHKTIKNLLDRQYSRTQVFLSKVIVLFEFYLYLIIINFIMMVIAKLIVFASFNINGTVFKTMMTVWAGNFLYLLILLSLVILISNIAKSSGGAIGIGVAFIFAAQIISQLLTIVITKYPILKWTPFNFLQVESQVEFGSVFQKITQLTNDQIIIGSIIYALTFFAIALGIFKKRNI